MTANDPELERRLHEHVIALASAPRPPGSAEHTAARAYIHAHLAKSGFDVIEDASNEFGILSVNLLTRPIPDDDELPLLIIGAHYDSTPDTPGADDNASA